MSSSRAIPVVVNGHTYYTSRRYDFKASKILGRGTFGVCSSAFDTVQQRNVAIKKVSAFSEDRCELLQVLREVKMMKLFGIHPNIITLYALHSHKPNGDLNIVMELMDCDLHRVISSRQVISERHVQCFLKQILEGLKEVHQIGLVMCNLPPINLLVSRDCQLRIKGFSAARQAGESLQAEPSLAAAGKRWYRAPEWLLVPDRPCSGSGDMFSVGCILAELLLRKPIFPGRSYLHQIELSLQFSGLSDLSELGYPLPESAETYLTKHMPYQRAERHAILTSCSAEALNLLELLLAVNPSQRPTAEQALQHPFLADAEVLHDYSKTYLTRPSPDYFAYEIANNYTDEQLRAELEKVVEEVSPVVSCEEDHPLYYPLCYR